MVGLPRKGTQMPILALNMELLSILVYVTVLPVAGDTVLGHLLEADTL